MHLRRNSLLSLVAAIAVVLSACVTGAQAQEAVAAVQVVAEDGAPLPARVQLIWPGDPYPDIQVFFTDSHGLCPLTGARTGQADLQVNHGPAWSIERLQVSVDPAKGRKRLVTLKRLYDLHAHGYYQGDCHMHSTSSDGRQKPAEVSSHCRCEGLDFAFLTDHESVAGHDEYKTQAAPDFLPLGGQEVTTKQGHILALGVTEVVSPDVSNGADDMRRIFRQIREQNALSVVAHPCVPTMSYVHWDVEDYDAVEILNGSAPPYMGLFDLVQARLKWHALLNEGKRVPVIGNSDNHDNYNSFALDALRDPQGAVKRDRRLGILWNLPNRDEIIVPWGTKGLFLGTYRTCLKLDDLSQAGVLAAIKAGCGFVTNGPIILATVNGTDPGSEISGQTAHIQFDAICNRGLERVTVVVDGKPAETVDLDGTEALGQELTVDISEAHWLTVECYGTWPDFATTNAWYVGQTEQ